MSSMIPLSSFSLKKMFTLVSLLRVMLSANSWWSWAFHSYVTESIDMIGSRVWGVGQDLTGRSHSQAIPLGDNKKATLPELLSGASEFFFQWRASSLPQGTYPWPSLSGSQIREGASQRALLLTSGLNSCIFSQTAALYCCQNPWIWGALVQFL